MTALLLALACGGDPERIVLSGYPNPFGGEDPQWSAQPPRENPLEVVSNGTTAWVSLQGSPDEPGHHVVAVDLEDLATERIEVGTSPTGLALHPAGKLLLVLNRFENRASVIDVDRGRVVEQVPTEFYDIEAAFTPDGRTAFVTNRWRDTVAVWDLEPTDDSLGVVQQREPGIPVGSNPRDLAMSHDGRTVAVASITGLTVSLIDVASRSERARIQVGAPPNGLVWAGDWLIVATLSASTHHLPLAGPDADGDGLPGDNTPNVNFQDLQNELAVYDAQGTEVFRATSDTICCRDFRDVDPADVGRHGDLLPPRDRWIVGGALPEQIAAEGTDVWVTYSGSNQLQRFAVDPATGALSAGPIVDSLGHNPHGIALTADHVLVADRLGETLEVWDRAAVEPVGTVIVGDVSGGAFPATDAEIGELFNNVTARFTVDGDQACTMCHREGANIDKAVLMPLANQPGFSLRMTMAYRGAADTRPWFFEGAMDQTNFRPVINEFARVENFCCTDPTLFPAGAPADCETNPPPECAGHNATSVDGFGVVRTGPHTHSRPTSFPSRDAFYLASADEVIGRTETYGDGVFREDLITGEREPIKLDFDGVTRSLGLFLLQDPALLPNPNPPDTGATRRGKALFERADVACMTCHPSPTFTASEQNNPFAVPLRMGPVVSPLRDETGANLDLISGGFAATFPMAEVDTCEDVCDAVTCAADPKACDDLRDMKFGVTGLRGLWDRAPSMLHDGRAKGLREVLCTPDHPALGPGEVGHNERDGVRDTHGGTSHLTAAEIDDLISYVLAL